MHKPQRQPKGPSLDNASGETHKSGAAFVVPFARSLAILSAFMPRDTWLGIRELSERTRIPTPTVHRLLRSLVSLDYVRYSVEHRKYRLAANVLALGYAAIATSDILSIARKRMQAFADEHGVCVALGTRERLQIILLDYCRGTSTQLRLDLHVGTRLGIASSPMGWALLAALPELERFYLLENVERLQPRDWRQLRRKVGEGISQVHESDFCVSSAEWEAELGVVATPLLVPGRTPMALACIGPARQMTRARVDRELGPRLLAAAQAIQDDAH
jgi:DNA-binding IclR family transcriptional regulator